jgi:hypothetical protein
MAALPASIPLLWPIWRRIGTASATKIADRNARTVKGPILTIGGVTVLTIWFLFLVPACLHFNV